MSSTGSTAFVLNMPFQPMGTFMMLSHRTSTIKSIGPSTKTGTDRTTTDANTIR